MVGREKKIQLLTIRKLQNEDLFDELSDYFLFKNLEESEQLHPTSFYDGWINIKGEYAGFY